jgi:6-phospho-3-hexuloisomerase
LEKVFHGVTSDEQYTRNLIESNINRFLLENIMRQLRDLFSAYSYQILEEISEVLGQVSQNEVDQFVDLILRANTIIGAGAGRMGMMLKAFIMRLNHLSLDAYHVGDCNVPRIKEDDLLIVASCSGETKTILTLIEAANKAGASIALITTQKSSSMALLSDVAVILPFLPSIQPMKTLVEQSSLLFFDSIILMLMNQLGQTEEMLKMRHSILE